MTKEELSFSILDTTIGKLYLYVKDSKVFLVSFKEQLDYWEEKFPEITLAKKRETTISLLLKKKITSYFKNGKLDLKEFSFYPHGTSMQKSVWKALRKVHSGKTLSYSELAKKVKKSSAVRAVATACGKNPFIILVPCHRVLGKNGLGGFSAGLWRKKDLLALEAK